MVIQTSLGGMFTFCVSLDFTERVCIKDFPKGCAGLFSAKPLLLRQSEVTWVTEAICSNLQLFQKFYQWRLFIR